jgi:hypothetical protein
VLLTLPGEVRLFAVFEDNLVAAMAHLLYLAAYLRLVDGLTTPRPWRSPVAERLFLHGVFPLAMLLAVLSHRQFGVLWPTPLLLGWFLRSLPRRRRWNLVLATFLAVGGGFLLVFAWLTWYWDGVLTLRGWLKHIAVWFIPVPFYRHFYFFNAFGWDLRRQAGYVFLGVARLFACDNALPLVSLSLWAVLTLLLLARTDWRAAAADRINGVLAMFVAVHVPHSLIYESSNIERWDATVVPLLVLLTRLFSRPRAGGSRLVEPLVPVLWALILALNLLGYTVFAGEMRAASDRPLLRELWPRLLLNVRSGCARDPGRRLLVLDRREYEACYMLAEAFYDNERSLLILEPDGELAYNFSSYLYPMPLDPVRRAKLLEDRWIVANPEVASRLQRLYGLSAAAFHAVSADGPSPSPGSL